MLREVIGIIGLIFIIIGNLTIYKPKEFRRKFTHPLLIAGGACLIVYSFILGDLIFIILQIVFVLVSIYGLIKINMRMKKK